MSAGANILGSEMKLSKITDWDLDDDTVYDDVVVDNGDLLTLSSTATSLKSVDTDPGNAPQSKQAGAYVPVVVTQDVDYSDEVSTEYAITITFEAGSF